MASVWKFECCLCHKNARWPGGIDVSLDHYYGTCASCVGKVDSTDDKYVKYEQIREAAPKESTEIEPTPKRLAIGLPGGFKVDGEEISWRDKYTLISRPGGSNAVDVDESTQDDAVKSKVAKICDTTDALSQAMQSTVANLWGGEEKQISEDALTLVQLPCERVPKPNQDGKWECEYPGCTVVDNVWLNLHDGSLLCGRKQMVNMDTMQDGMQHALTHYETTGRQYPLVVKLGTIDASGDADVFSYKDDNMVIDPNLKEHLAHFGLDIKTMTRTARTLEELQVELNLQHDWSAMAGDTDGEQVYGPLRTGLVNLGNTCYMNSILQLLSHVPFVRRMYSPDLVEQWVEALGSQRINPFRHMNVLIGKLFNSMASGEHAKKPSDEHPDWRNSISPLALRRLLGEDHPDFGSGRQQDAEEFIRYLFTKSELDKPPFSDKCMPDAFKCLKEIRVRDCATSKVGYRSEEELLLSLPVDVSLSINKEEYEGYLEAIRQGVSLDDVMYVCPRVQLPALIAKMFDEELIPDGRSPIDNKPTGLTQRTRLATFPDLLWITIKRFQWNDMGQPVKLPVEIIDAMTLDLTDHRGIGPQPDEALLDKQAVQRTGAPVVNEEFVQMLVGMGFNEALSREAVKQTSNAGAEPALNWLLADPDATPSNDEASSSSATSADGYTDGVGLYCLKGIVVHLGRNTASGHYVAYVKTDDHGWVCYNDEKVYTVPESAVPVSRAYMMLYERL